MTVKLYWNKICPFVHRAWIACVEKNIPVELVEVPLGGTMPEWYTKINPRETVPTLEHNGKFIFESNLIVKYIDEAFAPHNSLYPGDASIRYQVEYAVDKIGDLVGALYDLLMDPSDESKAEATVNLKAIDALIVGPGPFFTGSAFSVADIALVPFLDRFRYTIGVNHQIDIFEHAPQLKKLLDAAFLRPSVFTTAMPADFYLKAYTSYVKNPVQQKGFTLYSNKGCPFAERARMAVALKAINVEIVEIDLSAQRPAWYAAINPNGSVPALVAPGGQVVLESALIVRFVEEAFPTTGAKLTRETALQKYAGRFFVDTTNNLRNAMSGYLHGRTAENLAHLTKLLAETAGLLAAESADGPFLFGADVSEFDVIALPFLLRLHSLRELLNIQSAFDASPRVVALISAARAHPVLGKIVSAEQVYAEKLLASVSKL